MGSLPFGDKDEETMTIVIPFIIPNGKIPVRM